MPFVWPIAAALGSTSNWVRVALKVNIPGKELTRCSSSFFSKCMRLAAASTPPAMPSLAKAEGGGDAGLRVLMGVGVTGGLPSLLLLGVVAWRGVCGFACWPCKAWPLGVLKELHKSMF